MEKLDLQTPNITDENVQKISDMFPNCVTEAADGTTQVVDFDLLKQELSSNIVEGNQERYQLTWPGKAESLVTANTPINKTLRPDRAGSKDFDNTENLYIEGDNLEVLKLLQETYLSKIKMIYIDPPYNTGKDFVYKDNFTQDKGKYDEESGNVDDEGGRLVANPDSNGRYHSDWLSMVYPRLKLARNLLSDDGVIFISIDDSEVHNLRKLCDEVFGAENFINIVSAKMKNIAGASGGGEDKRLKKNIEYILIYAKKYQLIKPFKPIYSKTELSELVKYYRNNNISWKYTSVLYRQGEKEYTSSTVDGSGNEIKIYKRIDPVYKSINQISREENISEKEAYYKYIDKIFTTAMPQSSIRTRVMDEVYSYEEMEELYSIEYVPKSGKNKNKIYEQFYKGGNFRLITWLKDVVIIQDKVIYKTDLKGTFWDGFNLNNLSKEGDIKYENGKKPLSLIVDMLTMCTNKNDITLDFFSGSSTTAHAIMEKNIEDGGNRKFILAQVKERILPSTKDNRAYINYLDEQNIAPFVTSIGKERIRRAGEKIKADNSDKKGIDDLDVGFRVLKVDSSNMKDVYFSPDSTNQDDMFDLASNIKDSRSDEDLLFMVLLDWGIDLSVKIERREVAGKTVYFADDNFLAACFNDDLNEDFIKALASENPLKVVLRDSGFASSSVKINVEQIFKQADIEVKVI